MTFTQKRSWTDYYQLASLPGADPSCTRTTDGNGSDDVRFHGTALFVLGPGARGDAGFSLVGDHARTGAQTETVAGDCAASKVFPNGWSIIGETESTRTAAEPNTGCGPKKTKLISPAVWLVGDRLRLRWSGAGVPQFRTCPFFDGANEASEGNQLPGADYLDVTAKVSRSALRDASRRRVTASGVAKRAATETCANLVQPCGEGISYNATASVEASVKFVFVRKRRR